MFVVGLLKCVGLVFCGFCCCSGTVTLFYEGKRGIDGVYRGSIMVSDTLRVNKPRAQLQVLRMGYGNEAGLKLKKSDGWDFNRGLKRERVEIIAEILCYCNQQKAKTEIMYKVNLNYAQLKRYLKCLTSQGLLVADMNKYATTRKGHRFLKLFVQLNKILVS